jgi:MurNAc alpha-1-phosphate uridylyltransferase
MRPITNTIPKPLVEIAGRTLLDRCLDTLEAAGVEQAIVNVSYLGDRIVAHLADRPGIATMISDERDGLLDSAGGVIKALPLLGSEPFFVLNADTFWIDRDIPNLKRLALAWDGGLMDILLMLVSPDHATGHSGTTDFALDAEGRLKRAGGASDGFVYAGAAILNPEIFAGASAEPHSLNRYFDRAIAQGRLFGLPMDGHWITVGTPDAIAPAEAAVARLARPER